ncbi:MAG: 50S ribosomal protein L4 [bacterium]|jgi:large subunit ribosomal protein L4|nr:50S ribosomal protein L4 [candidate division KSB1 bacterium]MDH7560109.1 50S ribosomal protein L4 [bacterium]
MKLALHKTDGSTAAELEVPDEIFAAEPNQGVIHQAVVAELANRRQGTASTRTRSMVRGGGRKPWRQKGRGTARAGTIRSPLWVGGGRVFGPHPRDYHQKLSKRMKRLARISALSAKAKAQEVLVVEDFSVESGKTRDMLGILKGIGVADKKTLLLIPTADEMLLRAGRNLPNLEIRQASAVSTCDILNCQMLVIQKSALDEMQKVLVS